MNTFIHELPEDVAAVTIVDGRIVSANQDPDVTGYLRLFELDVKQRAAIWKMGEAGLFGEAEIDEVSD